MQEKYMSKKLEILKEMRVNLMKISLRIVRKDRLFHELWEYLRKLKSLMK